MTRDEIDAKLREALEGLAISGVTAGANPLKEGGMSAPLWHMSCALCGARWSKKQWQQPREHPPEDKCILALQGEPERGKTWQPIATAPRDATRVLVFCPSRHPPTREVFEAWWAIPYESAPLERGWWAYDGDKTMLSHDVHGIGATHWRPLPDPPPPPPQR